MILYLVSRSRVKKRYDWNTWTGCLTCLLVVSVFSEGKKWLFHTPSCPSISSSSQWWKRHVQPLPFRYYVDRSTSLFVEFMSRGESSTSVCDGINNPLKRKVKRGREIQEEHTKLCTRFGKQRANLILINPPITIIPNIWIKQRTGWSF